MDGAKLVVQDALRVVSMERIAAILPLPVTCLTEEAVLTHVRIEQCGLTFLGTYEGQTDLEVEQLVFLMLSVAWPAEKVSEAINVTRDEAWTFISVGGVPLSEWFPSVLRDDSSEVFPRRVADALREAAHFSEPTTTLDVRIWWTWGEAEEPGTFVGAETRLVEMLPGNPGAVRPMVASRTSRPHLPDRKRPLRYALLPGCETLSVDEIVIGASAQPVTSIDWRNYQAVQNATSGPMGFRIRYRPEEEVEMEAIIPIETEASQADVEPLLLTFARAIDEDEYQPLHHLDDL